MLDDVARTEASKRNEFYPFSPLNQDLIERGWEEEYLPAESKRDEGRKRRCGEFRKF